MSDGSNGNANGVDQVEVKRHRSRSPVARSRSRSRSPKRSRSDRSSRPFQGGNRVVVRNIPYEIRWQELKDIFRKDIGEVTFVRMLETPDGKSKGVALVEFKGPEYARKAIDEFHQKKLHDRSIIVREEREKDRHEFMASENMRYGGDRGGPGMGPGPGSNMAGMGGVNPQVLQQLGIDGPISNTVFVANLDYKVTWWKLKDVFKLAGNVLNAEIKEKDGKSRGMGVVTFEHPMEAVQAVSMFNGQVLFDRNMIVRIDKVEPEKPKLPSGLKSIGMGLGSGGAPLTNFNQMGSGGNYGMSDPFMNKDLGLGGGSGLLGMGGGASGLGLLGSGSDLGLGGMGGGLGSMLGSGGGGISDLGLGSSKLGMSDNYSGSSYNSFNTPSSLGGISGLGSMSGGMGGMGSSGDRLGGMDRLSMLESINRDRMGSGLDRMGGMDRMAGMDKMRDGFGGGRDMMRDSRDMRDDNRRRTTQPNNCTLMVKNLPYATTWKELKEHFRDAGDVKFAEIVMEKGRSTGVGYVRFGNESDAVRAVGMKNRSRIDRRNIDVNLFRN